MSDGWSDHDDRAIAKQLRNTARYLSGEQAQSATDTTVQLLREAADRLTDDTPPPIDHYRDFADQARAGEMLAEVAGKDERARRALEELVDVLRLNLQGAMAALEDVEGGDE